MAQTNGRPRSIRSMVRGAHIEFATIPVQSSCQRKTSFTSTEVSVIETEISNLLQKPVFCKTHHEPGEYVSPIFVRPKKDGTTRMILNLKSLNQSVVYLHFKMDNIKGCDSFDEAKLLHGFY